MGAVLLLTAFLVGWYSWNLNVTSSSSGFVGTASITATFNLGNTLDAQYTATFFGVSQSTTASQTYAHGNLTSTGNLYQTSQYLVLVAILLGFVAGVFAILPGNRPGVRRGAMALGLAALLLAIAVPVTIAVVQPGALNHDKAKTSGITGVPANASSNATGPWSSFFGSCASVRDCVGSSVNNTSGVSVSENWGPGAGWYLSLAAFVFFLVGILFSRRGQGAAAPSAYPPSGLPYYSPTAPGTMGPPPGNQPPPASWPPAPAPSPVPPPTPGWPPPGPS